jgi:anion-transporting  ArsA/GET3 family ATPase
MRSPIHTKADFIRALQMLSKALSTTDQKEKAKDYAETIEEIEKIKDNLEAITSQLNDEDGNTPEVATLEYRRSPKGVETIERVKR